MHLPESLREKLKTPLGILLYNNQVNKENIQKHIPKNSIVITVGDKTTENLLSFGLIPDIQIIDNQEKREKKQFSSKVELATKLSCKNPAGEITSQSIEIIKKAFSSKPPVKITIDGEEDLLVIPVCLYAPENSIVMYGQPNEGLVIVTINAEIRNKAQSILDLME